MGERNSNLPKIQRIALISMGAILGFAGCTVGPDFQKPAISLPSSVLPVDHASETLSAPVHGGETQQYVYGATAPQEWWRQFNSPVIDSLVDRAFKESPRVEAVRAALRAAQENVNAERAGFWPEISGSLGTSRQKVSGASDGLPADQSFSYSLSTASVNVSYDFDLFGKKQRGVEAREASRNSQYNEVEAAYQTLAANVVTAAIAQASVAAQIEVTDDLITSAREQLNITSKLYSLGGVDLSDVNTAEANLAELESSRSSLKQQLRSIHSELAVYVGEFPTEFGEPTIALDSLNLPRQIPVILPSSLLEGRPDIREAESRVHEASAKIGVATADMLPNINITASAGGAADTFSNLLETGVYSLAANVLQPIFEGGALRARRQAAVDVYNEALANYRQTALLAFKNVGDTLDSLDTDAERLLAESKARSASDQTLRVLKARYVLGDVSALEVFTAEQLYQKASIRYIQALASRYVDTTALFLALGGVCNLDQRSYRESR